MVSEQDSVKVANGAEVAPLFEVGNWVKQTIRGKASIITKSADASLIIFCKKGEIGAVIVFNEDLGEGFTIMALEYDGRLTREQWDVKGTVATARGSNFLIGMLDTGILVAQAITSDTAQRFDVSGVRKAVNPVMKECGF